MSAADDLDGWSCAGQMDLLGTCPACGRTTTETLLGPRCTNRRCRDPWKIEEKEPRS